MKKNKERTLFPGGWWKFSVKKCLKIWISHGARGNQTETSLYPVTWHRKLPPSYHIRVGRNYHWYCCSVSADREHHIQHYKAGAPPFSHQHHRVRAMCGVNVSHILQLGVGIGALVPELPSYALWAKQISFSVWKLAPEATLFKKSTPTMEDLGKGPLFPPTLGL